MVFTRNQTENMIVDKFVEEFLRLLDVLPKLSDLTEKIKGLLSKHEKVYSELQISKNCNSHLFQRIIQLERNAITNSQYHRREANSQIHRRETIETNFVPEKVGDLCFL